MYELILYLKFYVKSEKTFQRLFKRLNVEKLAHNVLTFYRFNNHGFGSFKYCWKAKEISFPTQLVQRQYTLRVDGNHRNKMTSKICQKSTYF
jgi:hypothetical protein